MTPQQKNIDFGFGFLLTWCIISALAFVYTGAKEQKLNPTVFCFYISLTSSLVFTLFCLPHFKSLITKSALCKKDILGINLATLGSWFFLFYPLKFLDPAVVQALVMCFMPISTIAVGKLIYKQQNINRNDYLSAGLLLIVSAYLIFLGFINLTHSKPISTLENILSVLSCITMSLSIAFGTTYGKKLSNADFSPVQTLCVRFIILTIFSGVLSLFIHQGRGLETLPKTVAVVVITSFILIIIPQLLYQNAIKALQPISIAIVLPFMPALVFFFGYWEARANQNRYVLFGIFALLTITIWSTLLRRYEEKKSGACL